jgi:hypothetical protein
MWRRVLASAAIATLVAAATACTSSTTPGASLATSAATSAPAAASVSAAESLIASGPAALYGRYTATIPSGVNAEPGEWTLTVKEREFSFRRPDGQTFTPGTLEEVTATEIVVGPDPGCPVQEGTATEGRYRWSREGDTLRLEVVSDSCQDRIDTLTSSDWSLIP